MNTDIFYKKINIDFSEIALEEIIESERVRFSSVVEYNTKFSPDYFLELLSKKIRLKIRPDNTTITKISFPGANPHVDLWPVALNFYLNAGSGETFFYDLKYKNIQVSSRIYPTPFPKEMLTSIHSFKPENKSLYLLNTHYIHSVELKEDSPPRYILRLMWNHNSFEEIAQSIEVL